MQINERAVGDVIVLDLKGKITLGEGDELLKDKVNYEVMGANEWKHAPSVAAMSNDSIRFHLWPLACQR